MRFNKLILFLLLTANIISFTACGNKADTAANATATNNTATTITATAQAPTEAVTKQAPTERTTKPKPQPTTPVLAGDDDYSVVDYTLAVLSQDEAYTSASKEEQIAMVEACLTDLELQGYIAEGSVSFEETHFGTFSFKYSNGSEGSFTFQKLGNRID